MSSRRTLILIAAIVTGLLAALALFNYVDNVEDDAARDNNPVRILRIARDIPIGTDANTAISAGFIEQDEIAQKYRPATAVLDLDAIRGKVAAFPIAAGQVLVDGMFGDPVDVTSTVADRLDPDEVAISMTIDGVRAVGGLIVPGDRVNMIVHAPRNPDNPDDPNTTFLFQNVEVLAIGRSLAPGVGDTGAAAAGGSGIFTFNVPPRVALILAEYQVAPPDGFAVYLTLVPPDYEPVQLDPLVAADLAPGPLTPYEDQG